VYLERVVRSILAREQQKLEIAVLCLLVQVQQPLVDLVLSLSLSAVGRAGLGDRPN